MDEVAVTEALQTDLNLSKVRIQVKWVESQLYILASRNQGQAINYDLLFARIQTRLEQLQVPIAVFTVYGKVSGSQEPEWKRIGTINLPKSSQTKKTSNRTSQAVKFQPQNIKKIQYIKNIRLHPKQGFLLAFAVSSMILAIWLVWERSQQQELIDQAQSIKKQPFDLNRPYNPDTLEGDRQNVNGKLLRLKTIPNFPVFAYAEAQSLISPLDIRINQINQKLQIERSAANTLDIATKIAVNAEAIIQNSPQTAQKWRLAQTKWLESVAILKTIPNSTFAGIQAQEKIKDYSMRYAAVKLQLKKQLITEAISFVLKTDTGMAIQSEMRDLKNSKVGKIEFMNACTPFVSFNLDPSLVKKQQVELSALAVEMCSYLWNNK
ncbi:hypothetical protein Syn7502_02453 [Synechococcus sp. PCC 7502]|uniref:hypothetical protein n=1 Tax=Synechococcus sp. PCC 7502 TaxID=1173263 RepID=UPI00029F9831|nr:hypothetical protein [Synechococcus sp. PCC 7502]AFY74434.1 hypothetical protein Syn7502_02453 [Synechococcus sp. PCC 7502]